MKHKTISLSSEFARIWKKIERGENIAVLRYGDGERAIMTGRSVTAQEGWAAPGYVSKLGNDLLSSLEMNGSSVYHAISCPCCDASSYYWYSTRILNKNITFANIWVNANYLRFINSFQKLTRDAVVIANYRAEGKKIGNLNVLKQYSISDDCFDFWENRAEQLLTSIKKDFGDKKNLLFVISAGPMSEPLIAELYKNNSDNCYIDFGSSIDRYYRNQQTRPYEDRRSVYAKRNCWMYDPQTMNFDVSVVLTLYKRPEKLVEQLDAIESQTLKPREILLFHDAATPPISFEFNGNLGSRITNYIKVDKNVGVWGRFAGGLLTKSKYVCFFDDDTIPGKRWLENCHTEILKRKGLYGAIGIDSSDLRKYPYSNYTRWGWANPSERTKRVNFVGHSWFLERDWLGAMWIDYSRFHAFKYVAEDAFLSYSLNKWLNIKTYVPPHPTHEPELYGSIPEKALEYGNTADVAISFDPQSMNSMNQALRLLVSMGMRSSVSYVPMRVHTIYTKVEKRILPVASTMKNFARKVVWVLKKYRDTYRK